MDQKQYPRDPQASTAAIVCGKRGAVVVAAGLDENAAAPIHHKNRKSKMVNSD